MRPLRVEAASSLTFMRDMYTCQPIPHPHGVTQVHVYMGSMQNQGSHFVKVHVHTPVLPVTTSPPHPSVTTSPPPSSCHYIPTPILLSLHPHPHPPVTTSPPPSSCHYIPTPILLSLHPHPHPPVTTSPIHQC